METHSGCVRGSHIRHHAHHNWHSFLVKKKLTFGASRVHPAADGVHWLAELCQRPMNEWRRRESQCWQIRVATLHIRWTGIWDSSSLLGPKASCSQHPHSCRRTQWCSICKAPVDGLAQVSSSLLVFSLQPVLVGIWWSRGGEEAWSKSKLVHLYTTTRNY